MLPYYPKDTAGCIIRFQQYFPYFEKDNISYDIDYTGSEEVFDLMYNQNNRLGQYQLYIKLLWQRFHVACTAAEYKAVFIHRAAFPYYYDQKTAYLEKLIYRLNKNVTLDFYDADYTVNASIVASSSRYCKQITVVNKYLHNHFIPFKSLVHVFPIAIQIENYSQKTNYSLQADNVVRVFYAGNIYNVKFLLDLLPLFEKLASKYKFEFHIISRQKIELGSFKCTFYHPADDNNALIDKMDLALYFIPNSTPHSKGKMAYKVLEYMSEGLPIIASPDGLSSHARHNENLLIASTMNEWLECLELLITNEAVRKNIGSNAKETIIKNFLPEVSYRQLKEILFN